MSLEVSALIANERHAALIREAAWWRRRREARHADQAERVHHPAVGSVYCLRAASGVRSPA
jgi:hypothetical protein